MPARLAIAQAALVTGWGTSDAAHYSNALFGRLPRSDGSGEGARRFDTLGDSVADYLGVLNTHPAFADFRAARAQIRAEGREPRARELAPYVAPFAADGPGFARSVARMIDSLPPRAPQEPPPEE